MWTIEGRQTIKVWFQTTENSNNPERIIASLYQHRVIVMYIRTMVDYYKSNELYYCKSDLANFIEYGMWIIEFVNESLQNVSKQDTMIRLQVPLTVDTIDHANFMLRPSEYLFRSNIKL